MAVVRTSLLVQGYVPGMRLRLVTDVHHSRRERIYSWIRI